MKPIIIANWKMNLSPKEAVGLAREIKAKVKKSKVEIVICPSFVSLTQVGDILQKTDMVLGAQDAFWDEDGAYTGEVSPRILKEVGCKYIIIGHSERRQNLGETNKMVNKKIDAVIENGLVPVLCIGETFEERQEGQTDNVLYCQLREGLSGVDLVGKEQLVIAYEPIWAIGSGQPVTEEKLDEAIKMIYQGLSDVMPLSVAKEKVRVIYGGSVDDKNVSEFTGVKNLDGFLVGGASLKAGEFLKIIKNV